MLIEWPIYRWQCEFEIYILLIYVAFTEIINICNRKCLYKGAKRLNAYECYGSNLCSNK